jgi:hypothetical protein
MAAKRKCAPAQIRLSPHSLAASAKEAKRREAAGCASTAGYSKGAAGAPNTPSSTRAPVEQSALWPDG